MISQNTREVQPLPELWKRGLNFTLHSADSDIRCTPDLKTGQKSMLLARVVKSENEEKSDEFEIFGKDMIIIYADRRIYPEYVIRYI
jgi:hypothetical protein